jgi:hypothetical protein
VRQIGGASHIDEPDEGVPDRVRTLWLGGPFTQASDSWAARRRSDLGITDEVWYRAPSFSLKSLCDVIERDFYSTGSRFEFGALTNAFHQLYHPRWHHVR